MNQKSSLQTFALRLGPGSDVRQELKLLAKQQQISAGIVLSAVGSLAKVKLRYANQKEHAELVGKHEILTLSGTLGQAGLHLHMTVADSEGRCRGGHLVYGCEVFTTLELVIGLLPELEFNRTLDEQTGFRELRVEPEQKWDQSKNE